MPKSTPKETDPRSEARVAVIGAGPAGLSAARALTNNGLHNVVVFEARARTGGRILTARLGESARQSFANLAYYGPKTGYHDKRPDVQNVDVGASVMVGCGDNCQFIFRRMIAEKVRAPIVAGRSAYEPTDTAAWMSDGTRISALTITEMHRVYDACIRYIAAQTKTDPGRFGNMKVAWDQALKHSEVAYRTYTDMELKILNKIMQRGYGYCAPLSEMGTLVTEAVVDPDGEMIDFNFDFDPKSMKKDAEWFEKEVTKNKKPGIPVASRRGGEGDRIVIDGYTPSLIDKIKEDLDIRLCTVIKEIQVVNNEVRVTTAKGTSHTFDYCVCTVPLGVLQNEHTDSRIRFVPELSEDKRKAINGLGAGVHNKVVLLYDKPFWTKNVPQMNCLDMRFQFFNLHAYGKTGVIVAHIYAESGFGYNYQNMSDDQVVEEVQNCLYKMFRSNSKWTTSVPRTMEISIKGKKYGPPKDKTSKVATLASKDQPGGRTDEFVDDEGEKTQPLFAGLSTQTGGPQIEEWVLDGSGDNAMVDDPEEDRQLDEFKIGMPKPKSYIVTRWDTDPFSLGSYSYLPPGADFSYISELRVPEKMGTKRGVLYFAGEHASTAGWQCVHGAYETGLIAAHGILLQEGLMSLQSRFEDLDDYPPPVQKKRRRAYMDVDEANRLNQLSEEYAESPGHLYDVLDEVMLVLDKCEIEKNKEESYVTPTANDRKECWNVMRELSEEGYGAVAHFMKMRWQMARRDAQIFRTSFATQKRGPREIGVEVEWITKYVEVLEEVINSNEARSVLELAEKFATRVYITGGAVIPWKALVSHVLTKLREEGLTLEYGEPTKLKEEHLTLKASKLAFPIEATLKNWANSAMEYDEERKPPRRMEKSSKMPVLKESSKKLTPQKPLTKKMTLDRKKSLKNSNPATKRSKVLENTAKQTSARVRGQRQEINVHEGYSTEDLVRPISTTTARTSTRKRRVPERYGQDNGDSTNSSSAEPRIILRLPLRDPKRRKGSAQYGEKSEEIILEGGGNMWEEEQNDELNAQDYSSAALRELLYSDNAARTHQNGPWMENWVGIT